MIADLYIVALPVNMGHAWRAQLQDSCVSWPVRSGDRGVVEQRVLDYISSTVHKAHGARGANPQALNTNGRN